MINTLCGSMGSIKSENSRSSDLRPPSPTESTTMSMSISESKNNTTAPSSEIDQQSSLTPRCLNFPTLKFELDDVDIEVQSPDQSIWESLFSEQFDTDFMVLSPVANNMPNSPQNGGSATHRNYNYNHAQSMQGQSLSGCSPPRFSSQLGAFSSTHNPKGKGLSPLRRVFNSPVNQYMQPADQNMQSLLVPASIEDFLDDYQRDGFIAAYPTTTSPKMSGSSSQSYSHHDHLPASSTVPSATLDCMPMYNSSRLSRPASEASLITAGNSQLTQERSRGSGYQQMSGAPLSQQLQQERMQEKQQQPLMQPQKQHHHQQQRNIQYNMMAPAIPMAHEQVNFSILIIYILFVHPSYLIDRYKQEDTLWVIFDYTYGPKEYL